MAETDALLTSTIANPRLWRLGLLLDAEAGVLTASAICTVGEANALCRTIRLAAGVPLLRALEDAVYDNPMLLADFDRTTILLRTPHFALMPACLAEEGCCEQVMSMLRTAGPGNQSVKTYYATVEGTDVAVGCCVDAAVAGFLGRTFAEARVQHALVPELSYFAAKAPRSGNCAKLFAVADESGVDVMAFGSGARLLGATSYVCSATSDRAYYAAALAQVCGIAGPDLQFYVAGCPADRDNLINELRQFAPKVMPWIVPASADAAPGTPFNLMILPLCE